ncbi:protein phosphatase 2C [Pelomyxa schiedti]|nr:protein phosphatase 2C [Pelomyxa schiedti]
MGNTLYVPTSSLPPPFFKSGHCSQQGKRNTMEDTFVAIDDMNTAFSLPQDVCRSFFAVYDGHGGRVAADHLATILHREVVSDPAFAQGNFEQALTNAFHKTDTKLLQHAHSNKWTDGATAVCTLIIGSTLYLACIGDAEAVLQEQTLERLESRCISFKHKPSDPSEKSRIESAGGKIYLGRVLGSLAVTRAFGDIDFKHPYNRAAADFVSAEPFTAHTTLTRDNQFMIVACDGLWDKLDYSTAVQICNKAKNSGKSPAEAAQILVKEALDKGTMDNVTCLVVYFDWGSS